MRHIADNVSKHFYNRRKKMFTMFTIKAIIKNNI